MWRSKCSRYFRMHLSMGQNLSWEAGTFLSACPREKGVAGQLVSPSGDKWEGSFGAAKLTTVVAELVGVCSYFWDDWKIRRVSSLNQEAMRSASPCQKCLHVLVRVEEHAGSSTGAMLHEVLLHQTREGKQTVRLQQLKVVDQCEGTDRLQAFQPWDAQPCPETWQDPDKGFTSL